MGGGDSGHDKKRPVALPIVAMPRYGGDSTMAKYRFDASFVVTANQVLKLHALGYVLYGYLVALVRVAQIHYLITIYSIQHREMSQ